MDKLILIIALTLSFSLSAANYNNGYKKQSQQNTSNLRLVSLAPHFDKLILDLILQQKNINSESSQYITQQIIVGTSDYARNNFYKTGYTPHLISFNTKINYEILLQIKPDLVLVWGDNLRIKQKLKLLNIKYKSFNASNLKDFAEEIKKIATIIGLNKIGKLQEKIYRVKLKKIAQKYQTYQQKKIFYQIWNNPIMTASNNSLIEQMLEICRAKNVIVSPLNNSDNNFNNKSIIVSLEEILRQKPELIIVSNSSQKRVDNIYQDFFKSEQIKYLHSNLLHIPGLHAPEEIEKLCNIIHNN